jgi:hypothetical protein
LNWDAIGAIGEVIGAVAVFVTLAYLAVQIRQNTHSVSTSIYESAMSGFNDVNRLICENAELSSIFRRGNPDPTSLDEEELFRFSLLTRNYSNHIYKLFRLYERGHSQRTSGRTSCLKPVSSSRSRAWLASRRTTDTSPISGKKWTATSSKSSVHSTLEMNLGNGVEFRKYLSKRDVGTTAKQGIPT